MGKRAAPFLSSAGIDCHERREPPIYPGILACLGAGCHKKMWKHRTRPGLSSLRRRSHILFPFPLAGEGPDFGESVEPA